MQRNDSDSLERLLALQGTDPGFFVLAVHSFIEADLRQRYGRTDEEITFDGLINEFREDCIQNAKTGHFYNVHVECLKNLKQSHIQTNRVRHRFHELTSEDARVATSMLNSFCLLAGIEHSSTMEKLEEYLSLWKERKPLGAIWKEYQRIYTQTQQILSEKGSLAHQVSVLMAEKADAESLRAEKLVLDREIEKLKCKTVKQSRKYDELRRKHFETSKELKKKEDRIATMKDVEFSLEILQQMTVYTRTRGDYEKTIIRLSAEQKEVLHQIGGNTDFLVKGHAGTGKTLVLLKAIEKIRGIGEYQHLGAEKEAPSILLLTYTNALVKYDTYIASILEPNREDRLIRTVDSIILEALQSIAPEIIPDTQILPALLKGMHVPGLSSDEVSHEIENFLWACDITRQEYIEEMIPRTGMRRPLKKRERTQVWAAKEAVEKELLTRNGKPFGYLRYLLLRHLESSEGESIPRFDYLFVDEAQDLNAVTLKILKWMAKKALILAGDADQAIYQTGYAFNRSGIDITGKSRILKMNFRNSVEIHLLAEHFRRNYIAGAEEDSFRSAFRDGPPVELATETSQNRLLDCMARQTRFFIDYLHYDPENICIITVSKGLFESIQHTLEKYGLDSCAVTDSEFTFSPNAKIRLNTMHSAKGLDFPVVLLYIPFPVKERGEYDDEVNKALFRKLLYVSITRAMEHLNVFAIGKNGSSVIDELIDSFKATRELP